MPLDRIKSAGKSIATGLLRKNLRRVAGGIAGLIDPERNRDSSDFGNINRFKDKTNILSFPLDVANEDPGLGNHGHYMLFYINVLDDAVISFGDFADRVGTESADTIGSSVIGQALEEYGYDGREAEFDTISRNYKPEFDKFKEQVKDQLFDDPAILNKELNFAKKYVATESKRLGVPRGMGTGKSLNNKVPHTQSRVENKGTTVALERAQTKRLDTVISMYMPANVKVSYKSNFTDTSIGSFTQAISQASEEGAITTDKMSSIGKDVLFSAGANAVADLLSNIPALAGGREAIEMRMGAIVMDRMEMAFKGIDKRKFSYEFKMMPRSQAEAREIRNIINMFKGHMLPEMVDGNRRGRLMTYPSTFDIQYMYQGNENNYINKVSTCYLETMDVSYGGDRYKTYVGDETGAPPVETTMTLNFGEIELITRERAAEGY